MRIRMTLPTLRSAKLKRGHVNGEAKTPKIPSMRDGLIPAHHYQNSLGHGWVSADFDIIYSATLTIAPESRWKRRALSRIEFRRGYPASIAYRFPHQEGRYKRCSENKPLWLGLPLRNILG